MMIMMSVGTFWASTLLVLSSVNPVKVSMGVLATGVSMFFMISVFTGSTWAPIIMMMLFIGGIIMMFMILSSILPNEKSLKMKFKLILFLAMALVMSKNFSLESSWMGAQMKSFLISGSNFFVMMTLIMAYFICSMSILTTEQTPMRTIVCH